MISIVWYDHEGVIQADSFHILRDMRLYLALLYAFQRFSDSNWGVCPELADNSVTIEGIKYELKTGRGDLIHAPWAIKGRATTVLRCEKQGSSEKFVAKISYPQVSRVPEPKVLDDAKRIGGTVGSAVSDHIPDLKDSCVLPYATASFRNVLGLLPETDKPSGRHLVVLIMGALDGTIRELSGKEYWDVWWDCFIC